MDKEIMVLPDLSILEELIHENIGRRLELSDLEKWNIPSGGGTSFQSNYDSEVKEIQGLILAKREEKRYYQNSETTDAPPDCYSVDRKQGVGEPGMLCEKCPHNQFIDSKGKACKDRVEVIILKNGDLIPSRINLPTMSLTPFKRYLLAITSKGKLYKSVVTKITLTKEKNKHGTSYSRAKFEFLSDIVVDKEVMNALQVTM